MKITKKTSLLLGVISGVVGGLIVLFVLNFWESPFKLLEVNGIYLPPLILVGVFSIIYLIIGRIEPGEAKILNWIIFILSNLAIMYLTYHILVLMITLKMYGYF